MGFYSNLLRRSTSSQVEQYLLSNKPFVTSLHTTNNQASIPKRNISQTTTTSTTSFVKNHSSKHASSLSLSRAVIYQYRSFSTSTPEAVDEIERESMPFDVLIIGGGPAGLAASIRLKQLCMEQNVDLSVCVVEKGSEIGAHILSGNVFDPKAIHELFPDLKSTWMDELQSTQSSHATKVSHDEFLVLTEQSSYTIPNIFLPNQLHNDGNYIISLGQLCRWLGSKAEELGVEIYPGFAASEVLFNEDKSAVVGVATKDMGIGKDGKPKETFERGVALLGRQTLFAEGARGSCSEHLISHFKLREGKSSQTYGLGIKEVWEIPDANFKAGFVQHTLGYPLQSSLFDKTFGGTFLYHQEPNLVLAGLVIGLDYANPYINPYKEFQRWKTHPDIRKHFEGGTCISYGARVLNEGGYHSIPKLTFKGGALIGCSAGFLNSVKIKGSHTAMKSGMVAAESIFNSLNQNNPEFSVAQSGTIDENEEVKEVVEYEEKMKNSWVYEELYQVRNTHEAFARWGLAPGLIYTGLATHITKGREPWTFTHDGKDTDKTQKADNFQPIPYPPHDGILTFDLLTNLQRSGTYHDDDQEAHLRVKPELDHIPKNVSLQVYAAPESRFCPAQVYEYVADENGKKNLVINAQNCVHCKCCSIKTTSEFINWTVPEGGGGPQYQVM
jgi:electron-transferring-flavoprotein dehydrogenase